MNNDSTDMGGDVTTLSGTIFAICFLMDNVQHLYCAVITQGRSSSVYNKNVRKIITGTCKQAIKWEMIRFTTVFDRKCKFLHVHEVI